MNHDAIDQLWAFADARHGDPAGVHAALDAHAERYERGPHDQQAVYWWVRGIVLHELSDYQGAMGALDRGEACAHRALRGDLAARCAASRSIAAASAGQLDQAIADRDRAQSHIDPTCDGFVTYLAALLDDRLGNRASALDRYEAALEPLRAVGDQATIAGLHLNRGLLWAYDHQTERAIADFAFAESSARALGLVALEAMALHNLGFTIGRLGDLANALVTLDRAGARYRDLSSPPRQVGVLDLDRAEVLCAAGLLHEARRAVGTAIESFAAQNNQVDLLEAELLLARILVRLQRPEAAREAALRAAARARRQRRTAWSHAAWLVAATARVALLDRPTIGSARYLARVASALERDGWMVEAVEAWSAAAQLAARTGFRDDAVQWLARADDVQDVAVEPATQRCVARGLVLAADGEALGALDVLADGLRLVTSHRASLGSTQARWDAATLATDLATVGMEVAFGLGSDLVVFDWSERLRTAAALPVDVHAPTNQTLAGQLDELRATWRDAADVGGVERRISHQLLRRAARLNPDPDPVSLDRLQAMLGASTWVTYVRNGSRIDALVVTGSELRLHRVAELTDVVASRSHLEFSLHQLVRRGPAGVQRWAPSVWRAARELDELIVAPLGEICEHVVLVPGAVQQMPWNLLPRCEARLVEIAASATAWTQQSERIEATAHPPAGAGPSASSVLTDGQRCLIAGPGLPGAEQEVRELAAALSGADVLVGPAASTARVLVALETNAVVHLGAHGRFRADHAMFSSLELADGPLTLYDLERLASVPSVLVLAACRAAAAHVTSTDEPLGTAHALVQAGVASVIAPLTAVPDGVGIEPMVVLHQGLAAGLTPCEALRESRRSVDDEYERLIMGCYLTFGHGGRAAF